MGTESHIADALFGHTRRRVLALFFGRPNEAFHVREILRITKSGSGAVQRELKRLFESGLVTRQSHGAQVRYGANPESPVFKELISLMAKTAGIADVVRAALMRQRVAARIQVAFIYGSVATGEQKSRSDVDLLVIGNVTLSDLIPALRPAQNEIGREINPTTYSAQEFRDRLARRAHFVSRVWMGPKLFLIGNENDLESLAGKPMVGTA